MHQHRDCVCQHLHSLGTFEIELSKSRSLQWVIVPLEDLQIGSNPLLNEDCQESCRQAAYEADRPASVYSNNGRRWGDCRIRRWGGRDGNLWGDRCNLLRDLDKYCERLLLVIRRFLSGIRLQILTALNEKRSENSSKQAGLRKGYT